MELINIARLLWGRRIVVGIGLLVAVAVGALAANGQLPGSGGSAAPKARNASIRVLVDTATSQLVTPDPRSADTVAARAVLMADLMASDAAKAEIARRAQIKPAQLAVLAPGVTVPTIPTKLSERTATTLEGAPEPYAVTLYAEGEVPIVAIDARAPGAPEARALARAAAATMASLTAPPTPEMKRGFVAQALGPPVVAKAKSGSGPAVFAVAAFLATFGIWCGCVVLASGLTPGPRRSRVLA
jgi:hypothetical protein